MAAAAEPIASIFVFRFGFSQNVKNQTAARLDADKFSHLNATIQP
jgi:hypothetical protein